MTGKTALLILAIVAVVILLPAAAVSLVSSPGLLREEVQEPPPESAERSSSPPPVRLFQADREEVVEMELDEYLIGVLLAEMPASFEMEALKAQAVIARTYTLHQHCSFGGEGCSKAPGRADVCSDSTHCQAWLDPEAAAADWGPEVAAFLERIREAVSGTSGEVVVYGGKLIEAVYHSTCGGRTEASRAIWDGGVRPYLESVECPYCQHSPHYRGEMLIPFAQLVEALAQDPALPVSAGERPPLEAVSETPGGRVGEVRVNGTSLRGTELRRLLALPSTALTWETVAEGMLFHTRGQGHGVGLCQYGADGAAREGKDYRQIIGIYYPGCEITQNVP